MADEKVNIVIKVDAKTKELTKVIAQLKALEKMESRLSSGAALNRLGSQANSAAGRMRSRWVKHFDMMDRSVQLLGKTLSGVVKFSLKAVTLEMGLLGASMLTVHGLFIIGRGLAKVYSGAMQTLAGGAAAAAVAIGTAAAAIREQQAAMFAYRGKGAGELGGGINQIRSAMRALQMDSSLAGLGVENLNKAFATMSKTMNVQQLNASSKFIKNLMDFGSAGQDPAAAAEKAGEVVAALFNQKKGLGDVITAAKALGPEMEEALKKANVKTKEQLKQLLLSGELAKMGGVAGQFDAVNQTLIGQAKTFFNLLRGQFADFGQQFLNPVKEAFQEIYDIINKDLKRTAASLQTFGTGKMLDGLVGAVEKTSNFFVKLVRDWLPRTDGYFSKIGDWWERTVRGFKIITEKMRPMIDGARVIEEAFKPIFGALIQGGADNLNNFRDNLLANRDTVIEFGERIKTLIEEISVLSQKIKDAIFDILPIINDLISGLTSAVRMLGQMFGGLGGGGGQMGSLSALMGLFVVGRQMAGTKGGFLSTGGGMPLAPMTAAASSAAVALTGLASSASLASGAVMGAPMGGMGPMHGPPSPLRGPFGVRKAIPGAGMLAPAVGRAGTPMEGMTGLTPGNVTGRFAGLRNMRNYMRYARSESRIGAAIMGNERLGIKGFQGSLAGKMGVGLGMSALSQVAPEEMRGALALGGMVGSFNPMAGLAIGGIGGALNAQGAGSGMLAGAGGGASLGFMVGGPYGALVGGVIGGIFGGIKGHINKAKKQASEARKAIDGAFTTMFQGILTNRYDVFAKNNADIEAGISTSGRRGAFQGAGQQMANKMREAARIAREGLSVNVGTDSGDFGVLTPGYAKRKREKYLGANVIPELENMGLKLTEDQKKALSSGWTTTVTGLEEIIKQAEERAGAFEKLDEVNNKRLETLEKMTCKSRPEIEKLAHELGVNLYDATTEFNDLATKLGANMLKTAAQMKDANTDIVLAFEDPFKKSVKAAEMSKVIDERARALRDKFEEGVLEQTDMDEYLSNAMSDAIELFGGDAVKAYFTVASQLGTETSSVYGAGGALEGMGGLLAPRTAKGLASVRTQLIGQGADNLANIAASQNQTINREQVVAALSGMSDEQLQSALSRISSGTFLTSASAAMDSAERRAGAGGLSGALSSIGLGGIATELIPTNKLDEVATSMDTASTEFKAAVDVFNTQMNDIFIGKLKEKPEWMTNEFIKTIAATVQDTRSPRGWLYGDTTSSRLSQTMSRHASMDSQLTGKRTVTSSYRTWGLGSPSSDHVTGRAYDLVGQNLGAYQQLVRNTGGFAEFHGVAGSRHLHVVPGAGGVGDTAVPVMTRPMTLPSSGGAGSATYNITVNGTSGMNAEELAAKVMTKIKQAERSHRERA